MQYVNNSNEPLTQLDTNQVFCGDCLEILHTIPSNCVDLIYLDPPFFSNRYFETSVSNDIEISGFEDRWSGIWQYIDWMRERLKECHRVLKKTGSLYLHCDWHASHYLKIELDMIFGPNKLRNEIIWKRHNAHNDTKQGAKCLGKLHDTLFLYTKSSKYTWHMIYKPYEEKYIKKFYKYVDPETGRKFAIGDLTGPGGRAKGNPHYTFKGVARYWRYNLEKMEQLDELGKILQRKGGVPVLKRYLDEMKGVPLQDVWDDIKPIYAGNKEGVGYPTQKPLGLLERIIQLSTNKDDIILDPFCGCLPNARNYELIISRKDPLLINGRSFWGFSIVRRRRPLERHSSSTYEYLIPENKILSFNADELPLLPGNYPKAYERPLEWGTCIKLYNYQIGDLKTNALLDLLYELNRYFFRIGLPIRVYETRDYESNYYETTLVGMSVRLLDNKSIIEDNFPSSGSLNLHKIGTIPTTIYALKKRAREGHWLGNKSIQFVLNGQIHAFFSSQFLKSKEIGLYYSGQDVLVVSDCTDIPDDVREDIFMPSRDRLRMESPYAKLIISELQKHLQKHEGLQNLEQIRRNEQLQEQFADNKPLKEIFGKLIKKAPSLALLFNTGTAIEKPKDFNYNIDRKKIYEGKYYPTFFRLKTDPDEKIVKECPINKSCTISFETDANNDYFSRPNNRGRLTVNMPEMYGNLTLWNGIARLRVKPPRHVVSGEKYLLKIEVSDNHQVKPFMNEAEVLITDPLFDVSKETNKNVRTDNAKKKIAVNRGSPIPSLKLPNIVEVTKSSKQWKEFHFNESVGAVVIPSSVDKDYDVYVNMDNMYYQYERQNSHGIDLQLLRNQYKYGLVLISLAMVYNMKNDPNIKEPEIYDTVRRSSEGLAMTILPVIKSLGIKHHDLG